MSDDADSFLGVAADSSTAKQAPVDVAANRVRWSLITFIVGAALLLAAAVAVLFSVRPGGFVLEFSRTWVVVFEVLAFAGGACWLHSTVRGCQALLEGRRIVLWWMAPELLLLAGFLLMNALHHLDLLHYSP